MCCRQPLPRADGAQLENELDKFMRITRSTELVGILEDMDKIKARDPEANEILTELGTVCATLKAQTIEVRRQYKLCNENSYGIR